jgi:hypothetical protein
MALVARVIVWAVGQQLGCRADDERDSSCGSVCHRAVGQTRERQKQRGDQNLPPHEAASGIYKALPTTI